MEIALTGIGILASVILYKVGYNKGKQDGHTVGYSHGMFKANELINEKKALENAERSKSFVGVKHRLAREPQPIRCPQEPAWIG
jgi:hypothetical protein